MEQENWFTVLLILDGHWFLNGGSHMFHVLVTNLGVSLRLALVIVIVHLAVIGIFTLFRHTAAGIDFLCVCYLLIASVAGAFAAFGFIIALIVRLVELATAFVAQHDIVNGDATLGMVKFAVLTLGIAIPSLVLALWAYSLLRRLFPKRKPWFHDEIQLLLPYRFREK